MKKDIFKRLLISMHYYRMVDLYNKSRVNKTIKENNHIYGMAYRCVVTKFDKFIKIANGKEIYYKLERKYKFN